MKRNLCIILEPENIPAGHRDLLDLNLNDADIILVVPNIEPNWLELIDELIPRAKHDILLELINCVKKELHYLLSRDKLGLGNKYFASLAALSPKNRCNEKFVVESIILFGRRLLIDADLLHEQTQLYSSSAISPLNFSMSERLDCWFNDVFKLLENIQPVPEFKLIIKKLLSIPHSQAFVERGFNLSKIKSDNRHLQS